MGERTDYVTYVHQVYDYLHTIPEKGFEEFKTSAFVLEELKKIGFEDIKTGVAGTGIIVTIDSGKEGPVLGLRADMDALEFIIDGKKTMIHACGHDGHMAVVLELARRLARRRDLPHNVLLVFQPAEETTGGARPICESGVFAQFHTRAIFGLHLWPDLPAGTVASIPGGMMCRSSEVTLAVTGQTAHVAKAAQGRDALEAAARWYLGALDLERQLPPDEPRLLKFGVLRAGDVRNALAGSARLDGNPPGLPGPGVRPAPAGVGGPGPAGGRRDRLPPGAHLFPGLPGSLEPPGPVGPGGSHLSRFPAGPARPHYRGLLLVPAAPAGAVLLPGLRPSPGPPRGQLHL